MSDATSPTALPPEGFAPHFRKSLVTDAWEPLFSRRVDGSVQIGLRLADKHCNSGGFLHGGVIAALADNAMGLSCAGELASAGGRDGQSQPRLRRGGQARSVAADRAEGHQDRQVHGVCRCSGHS